MQINLPYNQSSTFIDDAMNRYTQSNKFTSMRMLSSLVILILCITLSSSSALAQENRAQEKSSLVLAKHTRQSSLELSIQELSAKGEHFEALARFEKTPRRKHSSELLASVARSAWALGLEDQAMARFDQALALNQIEQKNRHKSTDRHEVESARLMLSQGMIEFQKHNYRAALKHGENVLLLLSKTSPLRSQALFLTAESLRLLKRLDQAEMRYEEAIEQAQSEELGELKYNLALCQSDLGKISLAKSNLESIASTDKRAAEAVRHLANLALDAADYQSSEFWLNLGKRDFAQKFIDPWVEYALVKSLTEQGKYEQAEKVRFEALKRFSARDPWMTLMEAVSEVGFWKEQQVQMNSAESLEVQDAVQ